MAHKTSQFNDVFEDMNLAEQRRHRQMGFTRGYSVGEEAGWRDGYIFGMRKGAQLSAEIGYYQGFAHAWISILEHEDCNKQRKINALHSLLEMTRNFPRTNNLLEDDTIQKLARIRAKFKQVNALIMGSGQYYSATTINSGTGQASSAAAAAAAASSAAAASAASHHHHPHPQQQQQQQPVQHPYLGGIYHRGGASCTSQESGVGTSSFRGVSPTIINNNVAVAAGVAGAGCPHHHHHHHHHHHQQQHGSAAPPPNVEMSF